LLDHVEPMRSHLGQLNQCTIFSAQIGDRVFE